MNRKNQKRPNQYRFQTKRDRFAFGEVISRSDNLGYKQGQLWRVEFTSKPSNYNCDNYECESNHAEIRLVFNYGNSDSPKIGSDKYCLDCLFNYTRKWLMTQLSEIAQDQKEYSNWKQ